MDLVLSVLIVIAVQLVSFLFLRGRIHQELNATTLLKDVQDEVDGMVRELNLSAERNIGLLEARIEELETLLAQADQKMVLLAREVEKREKTTEVYSQLKRSFPVAETEPEPVVPVAPPPMPVSEVSVATQEPVPSMMPVVPMVPSAPVPLPEPPRPRSLKDRVLAFRDQGADVAAIASATGATRGEVELILSLNP